MEDEPLRTKPPASARAVYFFFSSLFQRPVPTAARTGLLTEESHCAGLPLEPESYERPGSREALREIARAMTDSSPVRPAALARPHSEKCGSFSAARVDYLLVPRITKCERCAERAFAKRVITSGVHDASRCVQRKKQDLTSLTLVFVFLYTQAQAC